MTATTEADRDRHPATARRATGWYRLRVTRVERLTEDAVAISLDTPGPLAQTFAHRAGQHVTVRHVLDERELRRSYSVCPAPREPDRLRLVVKRLGPGGFAEYAVTRLTAGHELELSPPVGEFRLAEQPGAHHVLFAGGSGVTPLLSMADTALREDRRCRVSLVHANRDSRSALLADELADLKDAHLDRFFALHVLSREIREAELLSGRVDAARLPKLLALLGAEPDEHRWFYLCGPRGMVETVRDTLVRRGADPDRIRFELFSVDGGRPGPVAGEHPTAARITARLAGRTSEAAMAPGDRTVLDAVLRARPETPYSCRDGLCGACRAKVVGGHVLMDRQYALGATELTDRYILTCRARPDSDEIEIDFDA
ncbi:phenylacetic acid degradation protein [Kitasatospora herbaricolor]|uniref:2Fe-2S iron-sulfur cluster-binding protein n=1 Tax=Kitasatospora herbaricolor TaxID=68217 RepID=UPI001749CFF1|nr:2Fe-2S iron-sulfur cluster-binding protein [Kitasatospora herbaricolor]MDQ0306081.1 ring-1,2-phenylacetyl-CoA epoxidase subunit PaaE [Kitasatospora herbaricolor]GGV23450.1 phenylacetic acid degradation protein [Kitasatospora herbaricolor]